MSRNQKPVDAPFDPEPVKIDHFQINQQEELKDEIRKLRDQVALLTEQMMTITEQLRQIQTYGLTINK